MIIRLGAWFLQFGDVNQNLGFQANHQRRGSREDIIMTTRRETDAKERKKGISKDCR